MSQVSDRFEQQVSRIHELIEQPGSVVTWNDHIPDPDNPVQPRQIDITIKRDGTLTIIECRIHNKPQDVKWIEELMGRRKSLNADAVIAVSHAGFTKGAIIKARKYGVLLRDFKSLTEEEIIEWGCKTRLWVSYHNFSKIALSFVFGSEAKPHVSADNAIQYLASEGNLAHITELIISEIDKIRSDESLNKPTRVMVSLFPKKQVIAGHPIKEAIFGADYRVIKKEAYVPSVVAYDGPEMAALERSVLVEQVDLGDFQITQASNEASVALDFNQIGIPLNSRIRDIVFDFRRPVRVKSIEFLSQPKILIPMSNINVAVLFEK